MIPKLIEISMSAGSFIIFEDSLATSVNEKQEISILLRKFSLVVFKYSPDNSDLSEKATA